MNVIKPYGKKKQQKQNKIQVKPAVVLLSLVSFQFRLSQIEQNFELRCLQNITPRSICIRESNICITVLLRIMERDVIGYGLE